MYQSELDPPPSERICDHCGAANDPGARECWLCERVIRPRLIPQAQPRRRAEAGRPRAMLPHFLRWTDAIPEPPPSGMLVAATVLVIAVAVLVVAPVLGIPLLLSVIPALLITEGRARRRWRQGLPMTAVERVLRVVVLSIVVPIALILALFVVVFLVFTLGGVR